MRGLLRAEGDLEDGEGEQEDARAEQGIFVESVNNNLKLKIDLNWNDI